MISSLRSDPLERNRQVDNPWHMRSASARSPEDDSSSAGEVADVDMMRALQRAGEEKKRIFDELEKYKRALSQRNLQPEVASHMLDVQERRTAEAMHTVDVHTVEKDEDIREMSKKRKAYKRGITMDDLVLDRRHPLSLASSAQHSSPHADRKGYFGFGSLEKRLDSSDRQAHRHHHHGPYHRHPGSASSPRAVSGALALQSQPFPSAQWTPAHAPGRTTFSSVR
jgi:hypothetical protein